jgi:Flp pilus assembly protein TadG
MVEFAIIGLLLFTLILGLIDFGWAFSQNLSVKHAAREGARMGSVNAETDTGFVASNCTALITLIKSRVSNELKTSNPGFNVSFAVTSGTGKSGDTGTVTVTYPLSSLSGFTTALIGGTMTSTIQFRFEQDATAEPGGGWLTSGTCP